MHFMNEIEVDEAARRFRNHPALGPATQTLANLVTCANRNSDGWAYWPKPCRAADKLMTLIEGDPRDRWSERDDVTAAMVKKTYVPIKAFLTRWGLKCELVEP